MSINMDGDGPTDYSDFEYQQISHIHENQNLTGSPAQTRIATDFEVLGGIGGLDNNEVAELVYAELVVSIDHEQSVDDQDVGSQTDFRGLFGANLPASTSLLPGRGAAPGTTEIITESNATADQAGNSESEDRIFAQYAMTKSPAFDDQTNGPGGAGGGDTLVIERPWRQLVGRGPVLDSSDDVTFLSELIQEDEIIDTDGRVDAHLVWDVAETSDAGRAFSVPRDM